MGQGSAGPAPHTIETVSPEERRVEHATMLSYFHKEKGDMTRYCHYDEAIELFPDLARAKRDADYYNKILDNMVEALDEEIY